jgi:hypothetical protein
MFQSGHRDRLVPEVQIVRGGDEGVDEGEAGHAQRLIVPDEEALHYRLESIPALHLASNCDRLQGLEQSGERFRPLKNDESMTKDDHQNI